MEKEISGKGERILHYILLPIILFLLMMLIACGCSNGGGVPERYGSLVETTLRIRLEGEGGFTKSAYAGDSIADINVWLFDESGSSAFHSYGSFGPYSLKLWSGMRYGLYVAANAGKDLGDCNLPDLDYICIETDGPMHASCVSGNVPMSGSSTSLLPHELQEARVALTRTCCKIRLKLDLSGLVDTTVSIDSVALRNIPRRVLFFSESRAESQAQVFTQGNVLRGTELSQLYGSGAELYCLENMQGPLLEGNSDEKNKTLDSSDPHYGVCTYLELYGFYQTDSLAGPIRYRMYLGSDAVSDFSLKRDNLYDVNVAMAGSGCNETGWRIDVSGIKPVLPGIGSFFYSDSTYSATYNPRKTCVGIVYDSDSTREEGNRIWIVALTGKDSLKWSTLEENIPGLDNANYTTVNIEGTSNMSGLYNTRTIAASANYSASTYPAAHYCLSYSTPGFGAGRWCLPSYIQIYHLFAVARTADRIDISMLAAGGRSVVQDRLSLHIWSSTPLGRSTVAALGPYNLPDPYSKNTTLFRYTTLRPILQF